MERASCHLAALLAVILAGAAYSPAAAAARQPFAGPAARPHEPPDRRFDLRHVRFEVTLAIDQKSVAGRVTQTFAPLASGERQLRLDADTETIRVDAITDGEGRALAFTGSGRELVIDLGRAYDVEQPFDVTIVYTAKPRGGLYFVGPDHQHTDKPHMVWSQGEQHETQLWLPTWDYPNDRATTEAVITVPLNWSAVSNGHLVEETTDDAARTRTVHWRQDLPHATYLITVVAGRFDVERATTASGVALSYYVPEGRRAQIERSFGRTADMLAFFSDWTAVPYPWDKYAQLVVYDFHWGGMENTSATTLTDGTLHEAKSHLDFPSDGLVAHELAHQWFGDYVTCSSWTHIWLNEGFATYFQALWVEHDEGADEFAYELLRMADRYFDQDRDDYRRAIVEPTFDDAGTLFDRHTYQKGALVLNALRHVLGDEPFQRGIRAYLAQNRLGLVETAELRIAMEAASGRSLAWFFDQWLFRPGFPELRVRAQYQRAAGLVELRIEQTQATADGTPIFRLPLTVRIWNADSFRDYRVNLEGRDQLVHLPSDGEPRGLTLDPGNHFPKRVDFERPLAQLETQLSRSNAAIDRITAVHEIAGIDSPRAFEVLARALAEDPFYGVRARTAKALGTTGSRSAIEPLVAALADPDSRVRAAAATALGELGSRASAATGALVRILRDDPSDSASSEAAEALGKIGGTGLYEQLVRALERDSHRDVVREKVFEGLGRLGDPRAIPVARKWSAYGQPAKGREEALETLGELAGGDPSVREYLQDIALNDPYLWARKQALKGLGTIGASESIPTVERAARNELDSRVRKEARLALGKIRDKQTATTGLEAEVKELRAMIETLQSAGPPSAEEEKP